MKTQNITYKPNEKSSSSIKQKILKELCKLYLNNYNDFDEALKRLTNIIDDFEVLSIENFNYKYPDIRKFEKTILQLDSKSISLIIHDFVFKDDVGWSDLLWSRSIYYSIRKKAINMFFEKYEV
ncbi:MAG: MG284/MPN403 family protein [Metamycoplasmataceae bacterium]